MLQIFNKNDDSFWNPLPSIEFLEQYSIDSGLVCTCTQMWFDSKIKQKNNLNKMKSFEIIRKNMAFIGINLQSSKHEYPFNVTNAAIVSIITIAVTTNFLYIFYEADSFELYVDVSYEASTLLACGLIFAYQIWVTKKINTLLNSFESIISTSEKIWYFV